MGNQKAEPLLGALLFDFPALKTCFPRCSGVVLICKTLENLRNTFSSRNVKSKIHGNALSFMIHKIDKMAIALKRYKILQNP